ncbi:MAG: DNA polymerase III subunit beta [Gammaproteobacteria bacterium]|nr:DNA polymerase III subunit beta [Gammaproteobacteria bacterium]MBT4494598.1 DNA polymerase III subunit beta [Gammaproteobacteria bacterium]MBT7370746.1 DNA polymerase III subunit beta [Gammaproteobacteria bacterium]
MKFSVNRESLLRPLQQVAGVVERKQTLPVLSNLLLQVQDDKLSMTGTDLEVELIGRVGVSDAEPGDITVPARKLVDICREIPDKANIDFSLNENRIEIRSGRFRSTLSTLPAVDFPSVDHSDPELTTELDSKAFKNLLDKTAFAMAQQDVRYFLNGMLIEIGEGHVRSVATDGHRLAMSDLDQEGLTGDVKQVIVPRKGVIEIQRLLQELEDKVAVAVGSTHLCATSSMFTLTTKLVDGKFPDYQRVIPRDGDKIVMADKQELRQALSRTAILSNEKFRGIRFSLASGQLQLSANNPEQEEAEETVSVEYQGDSLEVGFNVSYLQDVLSVIENERVRVTLADANSSAVLEDPELEDAIYVVMPMKL